MKTNEQIWQENEEADLLHHKLRTGQLPLHNSPPQNKENTVSVGVVGYSSGKFDEDVAFGLLYTAIGRAFSMTRTSTKFYGSVVSGYTAIGIPKLAYECLPYTPCQRTVGIACSKAKDYECYPCDEVHIIGDNWGDESSFFLDYIDCLVRVGGGKQSLAEAETFKKKYPNKPIIEIELPLLS